MLLLILDCGLRLSETIGLRLGEVSLATRTLVINGKGTKQRQVFMGHRTAKALKRQQRKAALSLMSAFSDLRLEWVPRKQNRQAHRAAQRPLIWQPGMG